MVKDYKDVRAVFSKNGRASFISHLDLMRTFQRAFKRAKIPVWHTKGFNPHVYIMFPLALSLGASSSCETMDFGITEDIDFKELKERMNDALPEGLKIESLSVPVRSHKDIVLAGYEISFRNSDTEKIAEDFNGFISQDKIEMEKKTKKGSGIIDLKPYFSDVSVFKNGDNTVVSLKLPAGCDFNINPQLVVDAFFNFMGESYQNDTFFHIIRTNIICKDGENFI